MCSKQRSNSNKGITIKLFWAVLLCFWAWPGITAEVIYGPENLLKTMPTPFSIVSNQPIKQPANNAPNKYPVISFPGMPTQTRRSLSSRLVLSRLYLPGRMVLGMPAEFVIKGNPGSKVALAMADRDTGAKPIFGHQLHLGPDRKVVAVGIIPPTGILELAIETPIQGDLVGQNLFFEAAIWKAADFSDLELATPVTSEGQEGVKNGVLLAGQSEQEHGLKFTPDTSVPMRLQVGDPGLSSGRL